MDRKRRMFYHTKKIISPECGIINVWLPCGHGQPKNFCALHGLIISYFLATPLSQYTWAAIHSKELSVSAVKAQKRRSLMELWSIVSVIFFPSGTTCPSHIFTILIRWGNLQGFQKHLWSIFFIYIYICERCLSRHIYLFTAVNRFYDIILMHLTFSCTQYGIWCSALEKGSWWNYKKKSPLAKV